MLYILYSVCNIIIFIEYIVQLNLLIYQYEIFANIIPRCVVNICFPYICICAILSCMQ